MWLYIFTVNVWHLQKLFKVKVLRLKYENGFFLKSIIHKFWFFTPWSLPSLCSSVVLLKSGDLKKANLLVYLHLGLKSLPEPSRIFILVVTIATWQLPLQLPLQFLTSQLFLLHPFFCLWTTAQLKINNLQFIFHNSVLRKVLGGW